MTPEQMHKVANELRLRFEAPHDEQKVTDYFVHTTIHALADAIQSVADPTADHILETALTENDNVNHPAHYTAYQGIEVIQLTEQMGFCRGNAVKYIARAGLKDPDKEVEDLRKAIWYLEREIARIENA